MRRVLGRECTFKPWGFDCVEVTTDDGRVRIGTDDSERLARFLAQHAGDRRRARA